MKAEKSHWSSTKVLIFDGALRGREYDMHNFRARITRTKIRETLDQVFVDLEMRTFLWLVYLYLNGLILKL